MVETYISFVHNHLIPCIAVFTTLIPLFLIWYRRAYIDPSFLFLLEYLVFKLVIDLVMFHYASLRTNNILFYNICVPVRYALLSAMFYHKFEVKKFKKSILYAIVGFTFFSFWDIFRSNPNISDLHNHNMVAYATTLESFLMLFWTLLYFYETINTLKIPNLLTFPFFWVCSGILLYYSSFIFIAPVLHYTEKWKDPLDLGFLEKVPYIFETVSLILFSVGIWIFSKRYYAKQ